MSAYLNGCSNNLSSRTVASQVLSALVSLTSVFGMRTGGTSPLTSPQWYISDFSVNIEFLVYIQYTLFFVNRQFFYTVDSQLHRFFILIQYLLALGQNCIQLGVSVINSLFHLIFMRSSPRPISIGQLNTSLCLHPRPIKLIVFEWSY